MNLRFCKAVLILCLTPLCAVAGEKLIIIHAGQLLAIPGQQVLDKQSILVSGGEIVAVVPGYLQSTEVDANYTDVRLLNLADQFVMPGLMDLHVHMTMEPRPGEHLRVHKTEADFVTEQASQRSHRI